MSWNLEDAVSLCRKLEAIAPSYGAHIALTGGCLYKDGERKDLDIIVYRIRQESRIDEDGFFAEIGFLLDIAIKEDYGFVKKAVQGNKAIDFMFPENGGIYYQVNEAAPPLPFDEGTLFAGLN